MAWCPDTGLPAGLAAAGPVAACRSLTSADYDTITAGNGSGPARADRDSGCLRGRRARCWRRDAEHLRRPGVLRELRPVAALDRGARRRDGMARHASAAARTCTGRRVLDLGCGYGWFCRWARRTARPACSASTCPSGCWRAPAPTPTTRRSATPAPTWSISPPARCGSTSLSSLALHYIENLAGLLAGLHAALAPGGNLVFSVEHPTVTAPRHPGWSAVRRATRHGRSTIISTKGRARPTGSPRA